MVQPMQINDGYNIVMARYSHSDIIEMSLRNKELKQGYWHCLIYTK